MFGQPKNDREKFIERIGKVFANQIDPVDVLNDFDFNTQSTIAKAARDSLKIMKVLRDEQGSAEENKEISAKLQHDVEQMFKYFKKAGYEILISTTSDNLQKAIYKDSIKKLNIKIEQDSTDAKTLKSIMKRVVRKGIFARTAESVQETGIYYYEKGMYYPRLISNVLSEILDDPSSYAAKML